VCIEQKIIIEVDGSIHDEPGQPEYDLSRQQQLEEHGFRVLRFRNEEIFETLENVLAIIKTALSVS
jgi:very-short-patch-repair endonuclease